MAKSRNLLFVDNEKPGVRTKEKVKAIRAIRNVGEAKLLEKNKQIIEKAFRERKKNK